MTVDTDPGPCRVCQHPRPPAVSRGSAIISLVAMDDAARRGCVTCGLLFRGLGEVSAGELVPIGVGIGGDGDGDDDAADRLRIDFNMTSSGRSLDLHLFGLGVSISASVPTSKWQRLSPVVLK